MNYAVEQRLRMIDFLLHHYRYVQRDVLMDYFGISRPQVSLDLNLYREMAPNNCVYNARAKRWESSDMFVRRYP